MEGALGTIGVELMGQAVYKLTDAVRSEADIEILIDLDHGENVCLGQGDFFALNLIGDCRSGIEINPGAGRLDGGIICPSAGGGVVAVRQGQLALLI